MKPKCNKMFCPYYKLKNDCENCGHNKGLRMKVIILKDFDGLKKGEEYDLKDGRIRVHIDRGHIYIDKRYMDSYPKVFKYIKEQNK